VLQIPLTVLHRHCGFLFTEAAVRGTPVRVVRADGYVGWLVEDEDKPARAAWVDYRQPPLPAGNDGQLHD
jgi:hypothetical protein